jgi:hypothetical protein
MRDVEGKRASLERNLQSGLRDMSAEQDELGGAVGEDDDADDAVRRRNDVQIQVCVCGFLYLASFLPLTYTFCCLAIISTPLN